MNTQGIEKMLGLLHATAAQASGKTADTPTTATGQADFAQVLQKSIAQVNETQQQAETMAANFAAGGNTDNLHEVMLSLQKASISFQEMVQVRNKLVSAYHDVMNMQV